MNWVKTKWNSLSKRSKIVGCAVVVLIIAGIIFN